MTGLERQILGIAANTDATGDAGTQAFRVVVDVVSGRLKLLVFILGDKLSLREILVILVIV